MTLALLCFLCATSLFSQIKEDKSSISFGLRGVDFFSNSAISSTAQKLVPAFQINYLQTLSHPLLRVKFPFIIGRASVIDKDVYYNEVATDQDYFSFGTALELQFFETSKRIEPYFSLGGSYTHLGESGNHFEVPFGAGIDIRVSRRMTFQLNAEYRTSKEEYRNNTGIFAGLKFDLNRKETYHELVDSDMDKDGVVDLLDNCPQVYGVKMMDGCPDDYAVRNKTGSNMTFSLLQISEIQRLIVLLKAM